MDGPGRFGVNVYAVGSVDHAVAHAHIHIQVHAYAFMRHVSSGLFGPLRFRLLVWSSSPAVSGLFGLQRKLIVSSHQPLILII